MQAYTTYHHCSHYSSWEMNLNIRVEVKVDANVDGLTDERTENRILISHHAKSRRNINKTNVTSLSSAEFTKQSSKG